MVLLPVGAAGGWAAAQVFGDSQSASPDEYVGLSAVVQEGIVGATREFNASAAWSSRPVALNNAGGVVTSVDIAQGGAVEAGTKLYSVSLRPVVAGRGDIPMYGQIAPGDAGAQVVQLQKHLQDEGFWSGDLTGKFTSGFTAAVKKWQTSAGFPADGVVQAGDIVWFPSLPARVLLDTAVISRGLTIAPGAGELRALVEAPTFTIAVQPQQAEQIPTGTTVFVRAPDDTVWEGSAGAQEVDPTNTDIVVIELGGEGETPLCADACATIPPEGKTVLRTEVVTVPEAAGLVVPAAAIRSDANAGTFVVDVEGQRHDVDVLQTARGMSLVTGVSEGMSVRLGSATP